MRHPILILVSLLAFLPQLEAQPSELERRLFELPDLVFQPIETPEGFLAAYELHVKQPIDHEAPEKGYFYQRAYLSHRRFGAPMVMATEGYARPSNRLYELTHYLNANQLDVEHRYFGSSVPDTLDYRFLNLQQATADLHRIRELLGRLYPSSWVSTGISKGGQTAIFYRYFYPQDVAASVPYVAPLNLELTDDRIYEFLDQVGTAECRQAIASVQRRLLRDRAEVLPRLRWYAKGADYEFTYLSLEEAFEYAVLEYPFSFWQLGHDCSALPDADADSLELVMENFMEVVGLSLFTDAAMQNYSSHYWQAGSEMGYYGYQTAPFADLLEELEGEEVSAVFMPGHADTAFEPGFVKDVFEWTQRGADQMIYIYGAIDTWTATGVPASEAVDARWFIMEGKDHTNARIRNMEAESRQLLLDTLREWMEE